MFTDKPLQLPIAVGQFSITLNLQQNLRTIQNLLQQTMPGELVVLPEGALSGYADDLSFLGNLDIHELTEAMEILSEMVVERRVHLIVGSCLWEEGRWWNAGIYFSPYGSRSIYRKVNLAIHERDCLSAGSELPVFCLDRGEKGWLTRRVFRAKEVLLSFSGAINVAPTLSSNKLLG